MAGEKMAITGGAGFIGSNLAKRLLADGHEPRLIDNLSSGSLQNLKDLDVDLPVMQGDLNDYDFAKESLKGIDTVYHFAANIGNVVYLHGSNAKELASMQYNIILDANVLRACVENDVKCVIYASSVSVYPYKAQLTSNAVFKEEDADSTVSPEGGYGWAKYLAEQQLKLSDMRFGVARIFHTYGPNIDLSDQRSQVMASLIRKAIRYPEEFVVWGDGTQRRCFVYIDDTIDAIIRLKAYAEKTGNLTINVGSTEEVTVEQLVQKIIKISGKDIAFKYDTTRPRGANSRKPDIGKAERVLGWKPTTSLDKGLKLTYDWEAKRLRTEQ